MRRFVLLLLSVLFCLFAWGQEVSSFKPTKQTPEPGTTLSCRSYRIVTLVNRVMATSNPDAAFEKYQRKLPACFWKSGHYIQKSVGLDRIPVRIFYPNGWSKRHAEEVRLPVMVFYHGGGFVWGSLDMFHMLAQKLSKTLHCIVVLPDYRLAPQYPYPVPVEDCTAVLDWVFQHIASLGGDVRKVGLMGDSAGANLALVTALKNRRGHNYPLSCQVLYYPTTTMVDTVFPSRRYFSGEEGAWYVLNRNLLERIKADYLQGSPDTLWQVSPLYARYDATIPPTLIITAQCDPLRDEGEALALKMEEAGVEVTYICYDKTVHGFVSLYPLIKQGRRAIRATQQFVDRFL